MKHTFKMVALTSVLAMSCPLVTLAAGEHADSNAKSVTGGNASWNTENTYWRSHYTSRPYYSSTHDYSVYEPAYHYGVDLYNQNPGKNYRDLDAEKLSNGWSQARGSSNLNWTDAQAATQDAFNRAHENQPNGTSGNTR